MILATTLALLLTTEPPQQCEMPKFYDTYGPERSRGFLELCVRSGQSRFEEKSLLDHCACHVALMESVIPFPELDKLSRSEVSQLFHELSRACAELGYVLQPKAKPAPKRAPDKTQTLEL